MRTWGLACALVMALAIGLPVLAQEDAPPEESPITEEVEAPAATPIPQLAPTSQPAPQPAATVQATGPGTVILSDNFDDPARAQLPLSSTTPQRSQGYVGGEYEIVNGSAQADGVADVLAPGQFYDSSISVDAKVVGGIQGRRSVEVICRSDNGGAYVMSIYPDDSRVALIRRQPSTPNSPAVLLDQKGVVSVRTGENSNRLELSCVGPVIIGAVNGTVVATINDPNFAAGRHGIGVRGSGTTGRFDNLVITQR